MSWSEHLTFPPTGASVAAARGFIQQRLLEHDLLYLADDVRLVTSELATNAARHAKTTFTVLLEGFSDSIRLTVTDSSRSRPVVSATPVLGTAGRGLHVVAYYSRDWGVRHVRHGRRNAKSVWALFDLRPTLPPRTSRAAADSSTVSNQSRPSLHDLLRQVQMARVGLRETRSSGRPERVHGAQVRLVASLTEYVEALDAHGLPVPYALRDELRIFGGTLPASTAVRLPWVRRN